MCFVTIWQVPAGEKTQQKPEMVKIRNKADLIRKSTLVLDQPISGGRGVMVVQNINYLKSPQKYQHILHISLMLDPPTPAEAKGRDYLRTVHKDSVDMTQLQGIMGVLTQIHRTEGHV